MTQTEVSTQYNHIVRQNKRLLSRLAGTCVYPRQSAYDTTNFTIDTISDFAPFWHNHIKPIPSYLFTTIGRDVGDRQYVCTWYNEP